MEYIRLIAEVLLGAGFVSLLTFLLTAKSIQRKSVANATIAEAHAAEAQIKNKGLSDDRIYEFLTEIKTSYKELIEQKDKAHSKVVDSLVVEVEQLKKKVSDLEDIVKESLLEKKDLNKKVRKRDYIIDQALKCKSCTNIAEDCIVIRTKLECEDRKTKRLEEQESIR